MTEEATTAEHDSAFAGRVEATQRRLKFVTALYVAVRNARVFAPGNEVVTQSIHVLLESVRHILESEGALDLRLVYNYLVINDLRVKPDLASMTCYSFVVAELRRLRVGSVHFEPSIGQDDLTAFIHVVSGFEVGPAHTFKDIEKDLLTSGVREVAIGPEVPVEEDLSASDLA